MSLSSTFQKNSNAGRRFAATGFGQPIKITLGGGISPAMAALYDYPAQPFAPSASIMLGL